MVHHNITLLKILVHNRNQPDRQGLQQEQLFLQNLSTSVFKTIQFETMPKYIHGLFQMRNTEHNLRGSRKLVIPYVNTTTYGLHSFRYTAANMWNKLTEDLRSQTSLTEFRTKVCKISFEHQCNCFLCK